PHVHAARAVRRVGTPHGGCAHTQEGAAHTATQKQSNNTKKEILAHHVDCWSTGSAANIHHKATCYVAVGLRPHSSQTISCRHGHHRSRRTLKNKRREWHKESNHLFVFLFGCWQMSACVLFFPEGKPSCLGRVLGLLQGTQFLFFLLVHFFLVLVQPIIRFVLFLLFAGKVLQ
ncbi:hypothetical protein TcCL_Unassigned04516, partial [Trypanosoma cruzi]